MAEIIVDLERIVTSPDGREYYSQVSGELANGTWEAWLEFVPLDDNVEVLVTNPETTQPTRDDVVRWSEMLTDVYLQGAFTRAVKASRGRSAVVSYMTTARDVDPPIDPFETLRLGTPTLRARLRTLTRPELLATIDNYGLNPARKGLTRLSDSQLVTFIITAAEVQALRGRR
jgi:hypothetical protein